MPLLLLPPAQAQALEVFVSVLPLQSMVERVGGERVQVHTMVQPGHSPATYKPTPKQITTLAQADAYFRVGVPFEAAWMRRIRATNPDMPIVDLRDGLPLRPKQAHGHAEHHSEDAPDGPESAASPASPTSMDAHIWTSPALVRRMAEVIRDTLARLDADGADSYAANQAAFDAELRRLDETLRMELAGLRHRDFLVYHPAWGYFADAYGLNQIPIEHEGKAPGARRLSALIEQARRRDARVILVQPQFDQRAARQVAEAIQGRVETVDPLSADMPATLRRLAQIIATADSAAAAAAVPVPTPQPTQESAQ